MIPLHQSLKNTFFGSSIKYKKNIYMIGLTTPCVMCLDAEYKKVTYIDILRLLDCPEGYKGNCLGRQILQVENMLYIPVSYKCSIICYDMDTRNYTITDILDGEGLFSVDKMGGEFYCTPMNDKGKLIILNEKLEIVKILDLYNNDCKGVNISCGIYCGKDKVFIFPPRNDIVLNSTDDFTVIAGRNPIVQKKSSGLVYYNKQKERLVVYNEKNEESKEYETGVKIVNLRGIKKTFQECETITLRQYLTLLI